MSLLISVKCDRVEFDIIHICLAFNNWLVDKWCSKKHSTTAVCIRRVNIKHLKYVKYVLAFHFMLSRLIHQNIILFTFTVLLKSETRKFHKTFFYILDVEVFMISFLSCRRTFLMMSFLPLSLGSRTIASG